MANIELVIKIDENLYREIQRGNYGVSTSNTCAYEIRNGTPLEKHDAEIIKETVESIWGKPPYTELLDKIRAEILEKCFDVPYKNQAFDYGLKIVKWSDVLDIIDKYRKGDKE